MNLRDYLSNIRKVIYNSRISVLVISQEVVSFSNDLKEYDESEDIKIWDPKQFTFNG